MVEPVSLQTVLTYLTLISVPVGVFYHIMTLRNTRKNQQMQLDTRQAQLFMQIYDRFNDYQQMGIFLEVNQYEWTDVEDFWHKYDLESNEDAYRKWNYIAGFYEGVGVLVKRGLIDPTLVDDLMSAGTMLFWEKYGPVIIDGRKRLNVPQLWEWVEYLYFEIKRIAEEQHPELKTSTAARH